MAMFLTDKPTPDNLGLNFRHLRSHRIPAFTYVGTDGDAHCQEPSFHIDPDEIRFQRVDANQHGDFMSKTQQWLPSNIRLGSQYFALLSVLARSGKDIGLVILDREYRPVWMNSPKEKEYWRWKDAATRAPDPKCHEIWNNFARPCDWCPVTKTFDDGQMHIRRSASPDPEDLPSLKYSQIISVPLGPSRQPEYVLEVIFFDKGQNRQEHQRLFSVWSLADELKNIFPKINSPTLYPDIIALFLLNVVTDNVTECDAYYSPIHPIANDQTRFTTRRTLTRSMLKDLPADFATTLCEQPEALQRYWGQFSAIKNSVFQQLSQILPEAGIVPVDWTPRRLSENSFAFYLPWPDPANLSTPVWLLVARNTKANTFLLREDITRTTLFLSAIRRHIEILRTTKSLDKQVRDLTAKVALLDTTELVDAVPFALGKKHELSHLITVQKTLLKDLDDIRLPPDKRAHFASCIVGLKSVTNALANLQRTLGTLQELQQLNASPVNIKELLDRVFTYTVSLAPIKIQVQWDYKLTSKQRIHGDPSLIEQVVFNVVTNSIKALSLVSHRVPTLKIIAKPVSENTIQISFSDNGIGTEQENVTRVFDRHFTRFPRGTGLGLYYGKKIVELHKGTISFTSEWGRGASVTITLPKAE